MAQCEFTRGEGKGVRCTDDSTHEWNGKDYCRSHTLHLMMTSSSPRGGAEEPRGGLTSPCGGAKEPRGGVEDPPEDAQS